MDYGTGAMTKRDYAATLAACLAYLMQRQRDACGLLAFDNAIVRRVPSSARPGHLRVLLAELDRLPEGRESDVAKPLERLAAALVRRGGRLLLIGLQAAPRALDLHDLVLREVDILTSVAHVCGSDLPEAIDLLVDGRLAAAALDRVIAVEALVEEGLDPLAAGAVAGKVRVDPAA
jgi:uncharacterized protein (DUF58 family)